MSRLMHSTTKSHKKKKQVCPHCIDVYFHSQRALNNHLNGLKPSSTSSSSGASKKSTSNKSSVQTIHNIQAKQFAAAIPTSTAFRSTLPHTSSTAPGIKDSKESVAAEAPEDIDLPNNEVEFTFWEPFNGKVSSGFTLYTSMCYKYWVDAGALCWLNMTEREGYSPQTVFCGEAHQGPS